MIFVYNFLRSFDFYDKGDLGVGNEPKNIVRVFNKQWPFFK